jgi:hypothetical protein
MAFFRSNNDHDIKITKGQAERAKLVQLAADAETVFATATGRSDTLALDGADDATMKAAGLAVRDAGDLVTRRNGAIVAKDAELAVLIASRDVAVDTKTRHATANEIETKLAASGEIQRDLESVLVRLAAFADWASPFVPEMQGLQNYCIASRAQIPEALKMAQKLAGYHGSAVLAGTVPATLRRADVAVAPPVKKPEPILTTVFAIKSIKWTDADGTKRITQRFKDVSMSPALARAALDHKAAVRLDDPLCKNRDTVGGHADPGYAFDLDEVLAAKNAGPRLVEPIKQSNPQFVETIGLPKRVSMS